MQISRFVRQAFIALMAIMYTSLAFAAEPLECRGLKIASGPVGKGYYNLVQDIKEVTGVTACNIISKGGLDNLNVLSMNQADMAIVPMDALKRMESDPNVSGLQVVAVLNSNFLHVFTNPNGFKVKGEKKWGILAGDEKTIQFSKLSETKGATIGLVGSAILWGQQLNKQGGYNWNLVEVADDKTGLAMLKTGQVHAIMTTSGWPHGFFKSVKMGEAALVAYDGSRASPYIVRSLNYSNIGSYNIATLGVQNVLVTRPFKTDKVKDVATLKTALSRKLGDLQDGSFEPGWKEISNLDASVDWDKKFVVAAPAGKK